MHREVRVVLFLGRSLGLGGLLVAAGSACPFFFRWRSMLGSRVMLADDGGGPAAVMVTAASVASAAAAAAAAVGAGRAGARLLRGAAVELRLHGFIELSVSLAVSLAILFVFFCFVLSALAFHFGALPSLKAQAACVLSLSRFTRASILVVEFSSHFAFMRNGRA